MRMPYQNGKYFWLRSLGASSIGEFIFTIVAYLTAWLKQPVNEMKFRDFEEGVLF